MTETKIAATKPSRFLSVSLWALSVLMGLLFFGAGIGLELSPVATFLSRAFADGAIIGSFAASFLCFFIPALRSRAGFWNRPRKLLLLGALAGCAAVSIGFGSAFTARQELDARTAGFASQGERVAAAALGVGDAARYRAHMALVAKQKAEAAAKVASDAQAFRAEEKNVIGRWLMPVDAQYMVTIRRKGEGYVAEYFWRYTRTTSQVPLSISHTKKGLRFDVVGDVGKAYYIVLSDGTLDMRDKDGEFAKCPSYAGDPRDKDAVVRALEGALADLQAQQQAASCSEDANCTADKFKQTAMSECRPRIEAQARYDFKWEDGFGGPMFVATQWHGHDGSRHHLLDFVGDRLKLQNGFGAWQNVIYACTVDADTGVVVDAEVRPGRIMAY